MGLFFSANQRVAFFGLHLKYFCSLLSRIRSATSGFLFTEWAIISFESCLCQLSEKWVGFITCHTRYLRKELFFLFKTVFRSKCWGLIENFLHTLSDKFCVGVATAHRNWALLVTVRSWCLDLQSPPHFIVQIHPPFLMTCLSASSL